MKIFASLSSIQKCALSLISVTWMISGCQLIKVQENRLNYALTNKTNNILTNGQLSDNTLNLLRVLKHSSSSCLKDVEICVNSLNDQIFEADERYAAISEIYLAKAFEIEKQCKLTPSIQNKHSALSQKNYCQDQQLLLLDKSLRYSYVYLFKSDQPPESRVFDQRQMQVRTFYNVSLSRLLTSSFLRYQYPQIPQHMSIGSSKYQFDLNHYPELKDRNIERLTSSYILKFTGFYTMNRQEGLGSEFVVVAQDPPTFNNHFILNPEEYFKDRPNPNIHKARYLSVSATAEAASDQVTNADILSGQANFIIKLFNPYQYKTTNIQGVSYTLTANYSVPFAMWLAENKLGSTSYRSLLNRTDSLRVPYLYLIEPYQPNKKVIVLIHGLASSPETWISLTNNILGDKQLRD